MTESPARGIRERNRLAITALILTTARRHLATEGAASLSLRAIAREIGMASSAVYRYFPSRDDLLTALIVAAYNSLADDVTQAESRVRRSDHPARFRAIGRGIRTWAFTHEHEYALIFGSPVPGYAAPQSTIEPASRVPALLSAILIDATSTSPETDYAPVPPRVGRAIQPVLEFFEFDGGTVPVDLVVRGLMAWTYLFGAVSFDLFGHRHNVIVDERAVRNPFFEAELDHLIDFMGLTDATGESSYRECQTVAMVIIRTILNVLWLVLSGIWSAIGYAIAGLVMFILFFLIITIPFGIASFRLAGYALWPFGRTVVPDPDAGVASTIGNVIWFIFAGLWLAIGQFIAGVALCITIIGIPFGIANFKLARLSINPLGKKIVPLASAQAARSGYQQYVPVQ